MHRRPLHMQAVSDSYRLKLSSLAAQVKKTHSSASSPDHQTLAVHVHAFDWLQREFSRMKWLARDAHNVFACAKLQWPVFEGLRDRQPEVQSQPPEPFG